MGTVTGGGEFERNYRRRCSSVQKEIITLEIVSTVEGIAALGPCYERLAGVTGQTLPFALQEWHVAWRRHFLNCNPVDPLF